MNKLWHHIGALNDNVKINYSEPFVEYNHKGMPIRLYRDVNRTEQEWLALSPADAKEIKRFCNNIRKVQKLSMPVQDIKGVKVTKRSHPPLSLLFHAMRAMGVMRKYAKISKNDYAHRFSHKGIRDMFLAIPGGQQGISMLFLTMGALSRGDGGFPEGGSLPFVQRIVDKFTDLGGKILYKTHVERIVVENGKVTGVISGDTHFPADAVIVASDTMAIEQLFDTLPKCAWLDEMYRKTEPTTCVLVSLGINADLQNYPDRSIFKIKEPIQFANETFNSLFLNNYANDPHFSPDGKTTLTLQLAGDSYDFWKKAKEENRYAEEKQKIADKIIEAIVAQIPEAEGKIEIVDVATPLTYERYCGNWKGSWMTAITGSLNINPYPSTIKGLDGVYFAGQRIMPPGGLPPALMTGRMAVQYLCKDTNTLFISEE
ncbi:MAG: FAD-dependent oxidoreductase, partial [Dysgonamonadaceae bacterium]|jgi:phytoene dehydrogenase-like protein|nr:FAD-dependent oxidoreductase [Dysgonamonadaceae bacterium]